MQENDNNADSRRDADTNADADADADDIDDDIDDEDIKMQSMVFWWLYIHGLCCRDHYKDT